MASASCISHQAVTITAILLTFLCMPRVSAQTSDVLLDEDIELETLLGDIPTGFNLQNATISEISDLPGISGQSANRIAALRDSLSVPYLRRHPDILDSLSPIEQVVLSAVLSGDVEKDDDVIDVSLRQGILYDSRQAAAADSRYYLRLHAELPSNTEVWVNGERDRAEPRALDMYSGGILRHFERASTTVLIGDYRPQTGQGLLFSRWGRYYGSGTDIFSSTSDRVQSTSFEEMRFLRGVYVRSSFRNIEIQAMGSRRLLDATIDGYGQAVTIKEDGIHLNSRDAGNLTETLAAFRAGVSSARGVSFHASYISAGYSPMLGRKDGEAYYHDPNGDTFNYIAFDGAMIRGDVAIRSEFVSMPESGEYAGIAGVRIRKSGAAMSLAARRYSEGYWSLRSGGMNSFGETGNEEGVYAAVKTRFPGRVDVRVTYDIARMLYRSLYEPMPDSRRRYRMYAERKISRIWALAVGYRSTHDRNGGSGRSSVDGSIFCRLAPLQVRGRGAWSGRDNDGGPYGDITITRRRGDYGLTVTSGFFDIPGYDARYYRYEYDVPGRGGVTSVWGRGHTESIVMRYQMLAFRYSFKDSDLMTRSHELLLQFDGGF